MNIAKKIAKTALWLIPATAALMCSSWAGDRMLEVWTK